MAANTTSGVTPREELALAIVEGQSSVKNLIHTKILGELPISYRNAHLVKATLGGSLGLRQISADKYVHAAGTKFERLTATFGDATVTVTPRGVEIVVPRELTLDYRNRFDVLSFFSYRFGVEIAGLTKEMLVAAAVFDVANTSKGSATNSTVAYTAANLTTISYIADTIASVRRLRALGEAGPFIQVMSGPVFERIRQAATVQAYTVGSLRGTEQANKEMILASMREFGISDIVIGDAYYNSGADEAVTLSQVWSNTYIATLAPGMSAAKSDIPGISVPVISGLGALAYWEGYDDGGTPSADRNARQFPGGNFVEVYPSNEIDAMVIRVKMSHKPFIGNTRAMDIIATQYS